MLIRSGFLWFPPSSTIPESLPTILVAGHENLPDGFPATTLDFDRFLASIDFRRGEMSTAFEAVRACTSRAWVRVQFQNNIFPRYLTSPDVDTEERECLQENLSDAARGFAYRETPYAASAPVAAEPVATEPGVAPVTAEPAAEPAAAEPVATEPSEMPEVPSASGHSEAPATP